jgi:hypothetical protein
MDTVNPITRTETAYYDEYEYTDGDGMYPTFDQDQGDPYTSQVEISFVYMGFVGGWVQTSGPFICGLDGDFGDRLLARLNNPNYILQPPNLVAYIYNSGGRQIHPKP